MGQNVQNSLFQEIGLVFEALSVVDSSYRMKILFLQLGYELPTGSDLTAFSSLAIRVEDIIQTIIDFSRANDSTKSNVLAELALKIIKLTKEIIALDQIVSSSTAAFPEFVARAPLDDLPFRLLDYLIIEYTRRYRQHIHALMSILGVFEIVDLPENDAIFQPKTLLRKIYWGRLPKLISEPIELFDDIYNWNTEFNYSKFSLRLEAVLRAFLLPGGLYKQGSTLKSALENTSNNLEEIRFPIFQNVIFPSTNSQFGVNVSSAEANGAKKAGFAIVPYILGADNFDFDLNETFEITFKTTASIDKGLAIVIRPSGIELLSNLFDNPSDTANFNSQLGFRQRKSTGEIILLGSSNSTRLAVEGVSIKIFARSQGVDRDVGFEVQLDAIRLIISAGQGDSFLRQIVGGREIKAEAGLVLVYSFRHGFHFVGSGGFELQLATHITLGPLEIQSLVVGVTISDGDFDITGGTNFKVKLGPLLAEVENIGITTTLSFPNKGGNLGPANLVANFKTPDGVGLAVDASVIKGGGKLSFNPQKGEYTGALELVFSDFLNLKAIGIITTRMPDGSNGFSLLIIITTEFSTGIQLGYGFTLLAVGGLLGLNRTMRLKPLLDGVRTGAINRIMFPRNVIANAPQIISDLKRFFPPHKDKFLIGPMAKLGWGTPTLVSLSLEIIIEIPGNIAILGVLKVALPSDKAALLLLQVSFFGALEFDKKRFYFFAKLFESRVFFRTIEGEMGLLVAWGKDPTFVISVGGFHPRFEPPKNLPFPVPQRVRFYIINNAIARIGVSGYFAVTSNTVQFGAKAELAFDIRVISISGHINFDALLRFSPFHFVVDVEANVNLYVFGAKFCIHLDFSLQGPSPWRASGTGTLYISLFIIRIRISADFDITWGNKRPVIQLSIKVMILLKGEFEKLDNWTAQLPPGNSLSVSLRSLEPTEGLVLHPVGTLRISQRAIPLDLPIDKVGQQKPSDAKKVSVEVSSGGLRKLQDVSEYFAPAQFQEMEDASKLNKRAYERMPSGLEVSVKGEQLKSSKVVKRKVRYEEIILDTHYKRKKLPLFLQLGESDSSFSNKLWFTHSLAGASVSQSPLSQHYLKQRQPFEEKIVVQPENFVVAFQMNNQAFSQEATFVSEAMAQEFMQQQLAQNDDLATDALHVIPQHEVMA
ncbi:hypothetical protein Lepto7375DRAFT_3750 [Leptolyngbya sp. PCC 7375]|nr:hypothetical protein Lepto7375DRAFT_3750 [Leptolyngbya sp. PCC 7375]